MSTKLKAGTATSGAVIDADNNGVLELQSGSTPTTAITIDGSQNVGVGSATLSGYGSNTYKIYQKATGTNPAQIISQASGNDSACAIGHNGSVGIVTSTYGTTGSYTPLAFYTSDAERMRIDTSGNLLVGYNTTLFSTPGKSIVVEAGSGGMQIDSVTGAGYSARIYNGNPYVIFDNNSAIRDYAFVKSNGATYATVTAVINNVSDYRLKENIKPLTGALERIDALKPVQYSFKSDVQPAMPWGTDLVDGFLAHEFGEVIVGGCSGEKDAVQEDGSILPQGVDMTRAIPLLVAAIKELKAEVDALKGAK